MEKNVLRNIRINNLKSAIIFFLLGLLPNFGCIALSFEDFKENLVMILFFGLMAIFIDWILIKSIVLIINPLKSDIFRKYGSVEEIKKILNEIENNKEYEDNQLIISKNYVADKKDIERIVAYSDILRVHKLVHKTNFVIDRYELVITDKYNSTINYSYPVKDEKTVDNLILLISTKCSNAKIGYSKENARYVKENTEKEYPFEEPENELEKNNNNSKIYACPECKHEIEYGNKFCKECGCKIDWD